MTDRSAPDDDRRSSQESELVFAYVDGTLDPALRAELEQRMVADPALAAEVEGLRALRSLLDQDAQYGRDSQLDVPPPHLLDAILRAEVAARPDEIRQAVALARTAGPDDAKRPLWARLSSWFVGGGVVVGATAAVLFVVSQGPAELAPPAATGDVAADQPARPAATPPAPPAVEPELAKKPGAADDAAKAKERSAVPAAGPTAGEGRTAAVVLPPEPAAEQPLSDKAVADSRARDDNERRARQQDPAREEDAAGLRGGFADDVDDDAARAPKDAPAEPSFDALTAAPKAAPASRAPAADPAPIVAPTTPAPSSNVSPPPPTSVSGSSTYRSADESKNSFLEQMKARKVAQIEREKQGAKTEAKKKAPSSKGSGPSGKADSTLTPTEAREELDRQKRLDQASQLMTSAERELAGGRPLEAADLAGRAEALGGSSVGLVPASTQARAFLMAKRYADSARVGSRLLQGDAADVVLVDGMIAGADAAIAIGDRRLAERLLLRALAPANKDVARRAQAQRRLDGLRAATVRQPAEAAAPAKSAAPPAALDSDER